MSELDKLVEKLVETMDDPRHLASTYSLFLDALFELPTWSLNNPEGRRIPWREAESAKNAMRSAFDKPGLYIFGIGEIPLYIGITGQTLWKRLRERYVKGRRSQCELAATYEKDLKPRGIDGFPDEIREWYRKRFGTSMVRLEGAVAFARHGIEGVWFAILPIEDKDISKRLEEHLIPVANEWNISRGYEALLNKQHR